VAVAVAIMAVPSMCRAEEAKVNSPHSCMVVRALERAESEFAATLSAHANAVAGCLISEVSGREPGAMRAEAASALVQAIATANPQLDSHTSVRAHEAVVKALRDRSVEVRVATVTALADFGDESTIPLLQSVAKSDPILSLRDYTAQAIARMCKRLAVQ
jgi:hypothetical protein